MATSMVGRLLGAAEMLISAKPGSAAFRRRAVSTAYYAVFHSLAKLAATSVLPGASAESEEYLRVYRALDHGSIKNVFGQAPLREHDRMRAIGSVIVRLQSERIRADYMPPGRTLFPREEAAELIGQARQVVDDLSALTEEDRRLLAICLLFRTRKD
jgi:uncharacterized protein (UPF0332 family)